ncbi:MAG: hypothetical protein ACP5VR_03155 [Acidimicrobiales bacterium]
MSALRLQQSAARCNSWARAEGDLYEVVGGWVATTAEPGAKIYFDACSQHHAWRAAAWRERFPANEVGIGGLSRAASTALAQNAQGGDIERLAVYCRAVLARAVVAYESWREECVASSDGPVIRTLDMVKADVLADWRSGEEILQTLMRAEPDALVAARAVGEAERLLAGQSLVAGA